MNARAIYQQSYRKELEGAKEEDTVHTEEIPDFDRLCRELPPGRQVMLLRQAKNAIETTKSDYDFKAAVLSGDEKEMRRHHTEMHQKFTLSFACLIFFFIGAPLGAIIRKGGLGMPVVISIFLFGQQRHVATVARHVAKLGRTASARYFPDLQSLERLGYPQCRHVCRRAEKTDRQTRNT